MTTQVRQLRRLQAQLDEAQLEFAEREEGWQILIAERDASLARLEREAYVQVRKAMWRTDNAERQVRQEQLFRAAAQQGLANYMREHGLGDRIGYEPRKDPALRKVFATGLLRDIVNEVMASRDTGLPEGIEAKATIALAKALG